MFQQCPVCTAQINAAGLVKLSYGPPTTKDRLHIRVCQYATAKGCINTVDPNQLQLAAADYYPSQTPDRPDLKQNYNL